MNKRLSMEAHLDVDELSQRSRQARAGVARSQWQVIWLVAQGRTCQETAAVTGSSVPWVRELIDRDKRQGPEGMGDGRQANPGGSARLSQEQQAERAQALEGPSPEGGLWSGPPVAAWMSARLGRPG